MKKRLLVIAVALLATTALFANGAKETASGPSEAKLRMSWWGSDSRHTPTLAALDAFHQANPNISVEGEYSGWDGYYQKLVTQIAGGTAADIMQIDQPWLSELSSKGNVFAEITEDDLDLSQFDPAFLQNYCTYEGKLLGLPTGTSVQSFIVDTKMLEEFGIDPNTEWTWENIVSEGRKIHQQDPSKYFMNTDPQVFLLWFQIYLPQLSGHIVNEDKTLGFTEEQATAAFTYFKQWFDEGIIQPFSKSSLYYNKPGDNPEWINGNIAAQFSWVSTFSNIIGNRENMESRTIPVIPGAKNTGVVSRPAQLFTVNANSKYKRETMQLLDYLFNDDEGIEILGTCRAIPSTTKGRRILAEKGMISSLSQKATDEGLAQAGEAQTVWETNSNVVQVEQDIIDEFGYGKLTPNEAAKKLIANLTETLASL